MTTNGLQVLLPPAASAARLQVFLPAAAASVTEDGQLRGVNGGLHYKCPSGLLTSCSCASYPSWDVGESVWVQDYKWPSSVLTTDGHIGYPNQALKGHPLGVTTTNGLYVFLLAAVVDYPSWAL